MGTLVKWHVIRALVKRDVRIYFTNPSGYMFITLFIFLSAATAFWQERFFLSNLANLNQLTQLFPQLLMLFIPALTMSVWSEERKLGTDELLLTLPATDFEVVLGKYLSVLAVYTASLALSLSHVAVLSWLGSPDLGLMFGNYLGFWLLGAALIAVGMLGSLLTANIAIAFALGAVLCALLVFVDVAAAVFSPTWQRIVAPLGVVSHFRDFSDGVVSLSALLYFLSVTGSFLYLNVLIVGRRHWLPPSGGLSMGAHHAVRALAAVTLVVCVNAVVARASARLDVTAERLHTLTDQTHQLLGELSAERPVLIRAFISPTVPEAYVQTRATLLGLLREIDVLAGPNVQLLIEETEPYTDAAVDAQDTFGITARPVPDLSGGRAAFTDVFLGVAFTCGAEEQVIPFFDRGLPAEYEIARSIRVVAQTERKTVGVVNTAVRLFGGLDFQTMRSTPSWSIVAELRKQYDVVEITPSGPITEELDGVVVVLPSSLTQDQMDHVQAYIEEGHPALLLVDPLPVVNIGLAPSEQPGGSRNPFMAQNQPPPLPKGNVQGLLADLGVRWDSSAVAWDAYNPHPDLAHLPPEVIFVGEGSDSNAPFNQEHRASAGLQELVVLYPGHIGEAATSDYEFVPLLSSGPLSGVLSYFQMVQRSFFGTQLNPALPHQPSRAQYILAAHVTGTKEVVVAESSDEESPEDPAGEPDEEGEGDDVGEETAEGNAAGAAGNGVDSTAAPSEPTPADSAPIEDAVDDAPSGEEVEPDVDSAASDAPTEATTSSDGAVTPEPAEPPDQASVVGPGPASAERGTTGEQTAGFTPEGSAPENRSEGPVASSDDRATTAEPQPVSEVARAAPQTPQRSAPTTARAGCDSDRCRAGRGDD